MSSGEVQSTRHELVRPGMPPYAEQRLRAVEALTILATENPERPAGSWMRVLARCQLEGWRTNRSLTVDELVRLPGVARKTANVVAAELGDPQGIVVDTHVRRLSQRLAFTKQEDPVKIERDLMKLVPRDDWGRFPHLLIWHGRRVCIARRPLCETCVVNDLCPSSRV